MITIDPISTQQMEQLYTQRPKDIGKQAIYYVNSSSTRDEIISKNRSITV